MNLREVAGVGPYWTISREERNVVALLYAALLQGDNLRYFLDAVAPDLAVDEHEVAVYVEYAHLRDLWKRLGDSDVRRRDFIVSTLDTVDVRSMANADPATWNAHFGALSKKYWQSPGRWSVKKFHENIDDHQDFLSTCKFSWAFNIKPDLVVHTTNDQALVIECKVDSREGSYPANSDEKEIFKRRGLGYVSQTELQRYLMESLLGVDARHLLLTKRGRRDVSWSQAFSYLDLSAMPLWAQRWIARYCS